MERNRNLLILSALLLLGICIAIIASSSESVFMSSGWAYLLGLISLGFFVFRFHLFVEDDGLKQKNKEIGIS
jgi:hypothetical protein